MITSQNNIYPEDKKLLLIAKEMYKSDKNENIYDYNYNKNISTDELGVWINSEKKEYIIGFRGNTSSFRDIKTNIYLKSKGQIKNTTRFIDNMKQTQEVKSYFREEKYNCIFTGFNLGGFIAMEMLWTYNQDNCVAFNAGFGANNRYGGLNIRYYSGEGDIATLDELKCLKECIIINKPSNNNNKNNKNKNNKIKTLNVFD
jgi:hypothetical protein